MINPQDSAAPIVVNGDIDLAHYGLTKREYFAALAMQGVLANGAIDNLAWHEIASDAVGVADALIAALGKEPQ